MEQVMGDHETVSVSTRNALALRAPTPFMGSMTPPSTLPTANVTPLLSPCVCAGKFFRCHGRPWLIRGVTYGPFKPRGGREYPSGEALARDLNLMLRAGINSIRLYTPPPIDLLDAAGERGMRVLVGLPWEQHVTFLDGKRPREILARVTRLARQLAAHPALLGFAVGNEIPSHIVRWYGPRRIEAWIRQLYFAVKQVAPERPLTYVNYPTTEYLELPFLDYLAFNVYLESEPKLRSYIARLHNLAGDRPCFSPRSGSAVSETALRRRPSR